MTAIISRIFLNERMQWTLRATCSECLTETEAVLTLGIRIDCAGCGRPIKIDPRKTVFHRSEGTGHVQELMRRFRWGRAIPRLWVRGG